MTADTVANFVATRYGVPAEALRVSLQPLAGGLESGVARARLRSPYRDLPSSLIVKELRGAHRREVGIYRLVAPELPSSALSHLVGVQPDGDVDHLFLEDLGPPSPWPWANMAVAADVCRLLARLHQAPIDGLEGASWDYEAELERSAEQTLELAAVVRTPEGARVWPRLNDLRLVVAELPVVRERLLEPGTVVIHGDVHPGNVLVRLQDAEPRIVLIDWARAREGSPFEDVASWLQSLGCWEPEARRRHDYLFTSYLRALHVPRRLGREVRAHYWLAGACNGLSGAIRYHLAVLGDTTAPPDAQRDSCHALRSWERVIRRAAHVMRTGC